MTCRLQSEGYQFKPSIRPDLGTKPRYKVRGDLKVEAEQSSDFKGSKKILIRLGKADVVLLYQKYASAIIKI